MYSSVLTWEKVWYKSIDFSWLFIKADLFTWELKKTIFLFNQKTVALLLQFKSKVYKGYSIEI